LRGDGICLPELKQEEGAPLSPDLESGEVLGPRAELLELSSGRSPGLLTTRAQPGSASCARATARGLRPTPEPPECFHSASALGNFWRETISAKYAKCLQIDACE